VALAVLTHQLFPASPATDVPVYEVGSVATSIVVAPFAFRVAKSPEEVAAERRAIANTTSPVFIFDSTAIDSAGVALDRFDLALREAAARPPGYAIPALQSAGSAHGVSLVPAEARFLLDQGKRGPMLGAVRRVLERWLPRGVASGGSLDAAPAEVRIRGADGDRLALSDTIVTLGMLLSRARTYHPAPDDPVGDALFRRLVAAFFRPSVRLDPIATQMRRAELAASVPSHKFDVRAGEKIVGTHEVVGREEHEKLRALRDALDARRGAAVGSRRIAGVVLFDLLLLGLVGLTIFLHWPAIYRSLRSTALVGAAVAVALIGGAVVARLDPPMPELIPIAFVGILLSALFDQRISMLVAIATAVLIGGQAPFRGTNALFIHVVGGAAAALCVMTIRRRRQTYGWIVTVASAYLLTAAAIGLSLDRPLEEITRSASVGAANALVSVLLAVLFLPLAEQLTGIETDLTLLEWSDLNRPLMQRLSLEAPGTYAHTIAIANLAEAACTAIGANGLLARVGAYYHDIGKLGRPHYFVENQARGRNPHDQLAPQASASIIRDHVRDGLALAAEYRLPRVLRAFITEHHGTGEISYFLEKARGHADGVANGSDYVYPGPVPQTAETAVVMLADGVEAAARVIQEPTPARVREVVAHIIRQRVAQGQLRDAPLTQRQLSLIEEQFTRVLVGMHHNRIEYPASSGGVTAEFATS